MRRIAVAAAWVAVVGICLPQAAVVAAAPKLAADVRLAENNTFVGQIVDAQGAPQEAVEVAILSEGRQVATAKTSAEGYFAFSGVPTGVYTLSTEHGQGMYRVWDSKIAPPAAKSGALLVADKDVVRGQFNAGFGGFFASPLVVAGIVAAAVAIPVAVHNANLDSSSSS